MTGYNIYKSAMLLLGYSVDNMTVSPTDDLLQRTLETINRISTDIKGPQFSSLSDEINISATKYDALCYGVAMLLSLTEHNSEKNRLFTDIYNAKRASALSQISHISDSIPAVEG